MKIVSTSPSFSKNKVLQNEMTKSFPGVVLNLDGIELSKSELIDYIRDADGLILGLEEVDLFNSNGVHKVVVSCKNGSVFGSQPYLAIRTTTGQYYHDNLYEKEFMKSWEYIFDASSVDINAIDKVSLAANDKYGNQSIAYLDMTCYNFF